jgi:ABC-type dipeptide/oligopeptide/nickel transport system permease subunit
MPKPSTSTKILWHIWRLKLALAAGLLLLAIVVGAVLAPYLAPFDPLATDITARLKPPSWMAGGRPDSILGTDQVGRDILSRIIFGARVSLLVGALAVLLAAAIGIPLGLAAGYSGRLTDTVISTLVNIMLTFPFVLLALAVIAVLGPSLTNMIIVLGITNWPLYTRVVRADVLRLKELEFVVAARALGMGHARLILRQIFPNLVSAVVVISSVLVARMIILESFLSFLGLGVQPPTPSWGGMLGEGKDYMLLRWWLATFPGLAIFVTTLLINLLGDGLRDWLDPSMKM